MNVIIRTIALLVSLHLEWSVGVKCPPSQLILPCNCAQYINQISCWNIKPEVNLTQIFHNLANSVRNNDKQLIYDEFKLIDSELTEFGKQSESVEDFFSGVAFNKITISRNIKLKRIHRNAFKSSFNTTTAIIISENPILANDSPNEREIFDFLNSFESLKEISLTDNNITVIPDKAFSPQKSLNRLSLIDNNIVSIGAHAFHSLPSLNYLILDGNRIEKISKMAFEFTDNEVQPLRLFLRDNDLNDDSFESGTFDRINRIVILDLSKNNMTHLKKSVFAPLFRRRGSVITIRHNPLICDCNFKWLYDRKLLYNSSNTDKHFIVGIQCNGTKHQSEKNNELIESHFQHCLQEEEDTDDCFFKSDSEYDYNLCLNSAKSSQYVSHIPILLINTFIFYLLIR